MSSPEIIQNVDSLQNLAALIAVIVGAIIAVIKAIGTVFSIAMSSPLEVALMKKNEQYRYKGSNLLVSWVAVSFLLIYIGFMFTFPSFQKNLDTKINSNEGTVAEVIEESTDDANIVNSEQTVQTNNVNKYDVTTVVIFLAGFFGIVFIGIILLFVYIAKKFKKVREWWNKLDKSQKDKLKKIIRLTGIFLLLCTVFFLFNIYLFLITIAIALIILTFCVYKTDKFEKYIEILKSILLLSAFLMTLGLSNILIWKEENYTSLGSIIGMILGSVVLALVMCFYIFIISQLKVNPSQAKIMYHDKEKNKMMYLYYRYNDEFLVAGEKEFLEECTAYYLVKIEDVIGNCLETLSDISRNYSNVYCDNIILQAEGEEDVALNKVIEKLHLKLQENKVNQSEYSKTKIYIKHKEKMVYFNLPNEKIDRDKQNFSL